MERAEEAARSAAALLDLIVRIGKEDDARTAALVLVNEVQVYLNVRRAALGMCSRPGGPCRFWASSGAVDVAQNSEYVRRMESAWDETILRGTPSAWPAFRFGHQGPCW